VEEHQAAGLQAAPSGSSGVLHPGFLGIGIGWQEEEEGTGCARLVCGERRDQQRGRDFHWN
jgi:hypothetical protein